MKGVAIEDWEGEERRMMKAVTIRMLLTLVGVALVAPFFAVALIVGARAVALSQGTQDDLLMMALAFGGAAASIIKGLGRRMNSVKGGRQAHGEARARAEGVDASAIGLGY
jgi:hypothetical protein